jgi:hypothetical protein
MTFELFPVLFLHSMVQVLMLHVTFFWGILALVLYRAK